MKIEREGKVFDLTDNEMLEAYNEQRDKYLRMDALHHLSETISRGDVVYDNGDVEGFITDLDEEHIDDFEKEFGCELGFALSPEAFDLVGRIVTRYEGLYEAASSDYDRWELACEEELALLKEANKPKKWAVKITETFSRYVVISDVSSAKAAEELAEKLYSDGDIEELGGRDFDGETVIKAMDPIETEEDYSYYESFPHYNEEGAMP